VIPFLVLIARRLYPMHKLSVSAAVTRQLVKVIRGK
jgi:hypothetical protein